MFNIKHTLPHSSKKITNCAVAIGASEPRKLRHPLCCDDVHMRHSNTAHWFEWKEISRREKNPGNVIFTDFSVNKALPDQFPALNLGKFVANVIILTNSCRRIHFFWQPVGTQGHDAFIIMHWLKFIINEWTKIYWSGKIAKVEFSSSSYPFLFQYNKEPVWLR
jgi:hypothetical protein